MALQRAFRGLPLQHTQILNKSMQWLCGEPFGEFLACTTQTCFEHIGVSAFHSRVILSLCVMGLGSGQFEIFVVVFRPYNEKRLTFWPKFYDSRNYLGLGVKKNLRTFGTDYCTEIRGGSCRDSHFGWRCHICKKLSGRVERHYKAHVTCCDFLFSMKLFGGGGCKRARHTFT